MARFDMIDHNQLASLARFCEVIQYLSDEIAEGGEYASMWDCLESLNEMGVIDKPEFVRLGAVIHDLADDSQEIIDYVNSTGFYSET